MPFQISALDVELFDHLFDLDDEALAEYGVQRIVADNKPGYPCRVSLEDAEPGENVLLMNYEHQPAATPFRSSHAIFVRKLAKQAAPDKDCVPEMFRHRVLSVRAFDAIGMLIDADLVAGEQLESLINRLFENTSVAELHIHNAKLGCYAARVERA